MTLSLHLLGPSPRKDLAHGQAGALLYSGEPILFMSASRSSFCAISLIVLFFRVYFFELFSINPPILLCNSIINFNLHFPFMFVSPQIWANFGIVLVPPRPWPDSKGNITFQLMSLLSLAKKKAKWMRMESKAPLLVVSIIKEGIRFPLTRFCINSSIKCRFSPMHVSINVVMIVCGISTLNRLGLNLDIRDIYHYCNLLHNYEVRMRVRVWILIRVQYEYVDMVRPKKNKIQDFLFFIIYNLRSNLQIKIQYQN